MKFILHAASAVNDHGRVTHFMGILTDNWYSSDKALMVPMPVKLTNPEHVWALCMYVPANKRITRHYIPVAIRKARYLFSNTTASIEELRGNTPPEKNLFTLELAIAKMRFLKDTKRNIIKL